MATLVIDNSTTVTNTPVSNLNISVVTGQQINVITITGPMGPQGPAGTGGGAGSTSGALSAIRISGSSTIPIADFTGIGGTIILYSGGKIFVSGVVPGVGGGVPSVNGITSAVTIVGTGNLAAVTIGSTIVISGSNLVTDKQILFDINGITSGANNFLWDYNSGTLKIGSPIPYPYNPLSMAYSGSYIQATIMNPSTANDGSSDWVATSNIGSDLSGYINLGVNNSAYNQAAYSIGTGGDGYLYVDGGDLALGTASANKVIKLHTSGTTSAALRATVDASGINMAPSMDIRFNNVSLTGLIQQTGQQAWTATNTNSTVISGNLTQTGVQLTNSIIGTGIRVRQMAIQFNGGASVSWSTMPNAVNFFNAGAGYVTFADLTNYTGVSLVWYQGTAGSVTGALYLGCLGNYSATPANYLDVTTNGVRGRMTAGTTVVTSGFQPLAAAAKSGVYLALLGISGNASASPTFGQIIAYFK